MRTRLAPTLVCLVLAAVLPLMMGQLCTPSGSTDDGTTSDTTTGNTTTGDTGATTTDGGSDGGTTTASDRVSLSIVKLTYSGTTTRGPAAGDGVIAFNNDGGAVLAWCRVGETTATAAGAPADMLHDTGAFAFGGKKLVCRDRYSGSLYVFDTETGRAVAISASSINMGGIAGPNYWAVDGNYIATINASTTSTDGANKRIKLVNISNLDAITITPFDLGGTAEPDGIAIDASVNRMVVRTGDRFVVYDITDASAQPALINTAQKGGAGSADIAVCSDLLAYFDDSEQFTLMSVAGGAPFRPSRNPGRSGRGLAFDGGRWAYFAMQTDDDGSSIDQYNRAIVGAGEDVTNLVDPPGDYVNGRDTGNGRVGFGATVAVSPSGQYVFVAGETAVGVDVDERLFVSVNGGAFQIVADPEDSLNALRACGVACSDNVVAFLIPASPTDTSSSVLVGYAALTQ